AEAARRRGRRRREGDREGNHRQPPEDPLSRDHVGDAADQPEPPDARSDLGPLQRDPVPEAGTQLTAAMGGLPEHALGLLGHWRLTAWTGETDAGARIAPGGPEPRGDLISRPTGRMAVQIADDRRTPIGSRDLDAGDDPLQAAAYRSYNA